jgi:hypothetical protein
LPIEAFRTKRRIYRLAIDLSEDQQSSIFDQQFSPQESIGSPRRGPRCGSRQKSPLRGPAWQGLPRCAISRRPPPPDPAGDAHNAVSVGFPCGKFRTQSAGCTDLHGWCGRRGPSFATMADSKQCLPGWSTGGRSK